MATRTVSVPAPVKGWNARDALAAMNPLHAVTLDNWFPDDDECRLRRGFTPWATGIGASVESLIEYNTLGGVNAMFAATATAIYDVSASGAVGAAVQSGLTNGRWQYVNIGTAGGQFVWMVNGSDAPRHWNGTTWTQPSLSGVTAADLIWCNLHQRRIFAGTKNSLEFAYLPVNSISGTFQTFSIAGLVRRGGYIMGMVTWSRDSGQGMDDLAVFVTSEGEAVVYSGTDPASADTWVLEGVFRIGKPIGRRFFTKFGADCVLITEDGFLPLSTLLSIDRSVSNRAISDQISKAVNDAVRSYRDTFGWDAIIYPNGRQLIFNVPQASGRFDQYVFNTNTLAPCRFVGMNAQCWGLLGDRLIFGAADGTVYQADVGESDNGADIEGFMRPAYSYFGAKGQQKLMKMARPIFSADGRFEAAFDMSVDFDESAPTSTPEFTDPELAVWNYSRWGSSNWGGGETIIRSWQSVSGLGYAFSLTIRTFTSTISMALISIDYVYETGGTL